MVIPFITALSVALLLGVSTAPGMTWLDAGDFTTASAILGVPHPTGFPTYTVLGHLFSYLPVGNLASRMALMSAIFAGVTVWFLMMVAVRRCRCLAEAVAVGGALVLVHLSADTLLLNGRMPEVYTLNTALTTACIYLLDRLERAFDLRLVVALGVTCGIGLTHHALFALFGVGIVGVLLSQRVYRRAGPLLFFAAAAAVALSADVYLPIAASRGPAHNFGDPRTLSRFLAHITAADIRHAFAGEMAAGLFATAVHFTRMATQLYDALGPLLVFGVAGALYPLLGLIQSRAARRVNRLGLLALFLVTTDLFFAAVIHPMGIDAFQNGQMSVLLLALLGGLTAARGMTILGRRASERMGRFGQVAGAALPLVLLFHNSGDLRDTPSDWSLEDLVVVHLTHADPGAMSVLFSDGMIAATLYAHHGADARPDMAVFDRNLLVDRQRMTYALSHAPFDLYPEEDVATWPAPSGPLSEASYLARTARLIAHNLNRRTVYWEARLGRTDIGGGFGLRHRFPVGRILPRGADMASCTPGDTGFCAGAPGFRGVSPSSLGRSRLYRDWLAGQWGYAGGRLYRAGFLGKARSAFENARRLDPSSVVWRNNLAVVFAAAGNPGRALDLIDTVLKDDPLSSTAVRNGVRYSAATGDVVRERAYRERADTLGIDVDSSPGE